MQDDRNEAIDATSLTPGERELELALGALRPAAAVGVDRGRALFDAGVAVGRRSARRWQRATVAMAIVAVGSVLVVRAPNDGGGGVVRTTPIAMTERARPPATKVITEQPIAVATRTSPRLIVDEVIAPASADRPGYLQLREQLLLRGPAALRPVDAATPLWMANPAARRAIGAAVTPPLRG